MERSRGSREGWRGGWTGEVFRSSRESGGSVGERAGGGGIWWRYEVRRWVLWILTGYSTRTSLKESLDFWRLRGG